MSFPTPISFIAVCLIASLPTIAFGQYRPDAQPVMNPPVRHKAETVDRTPDFARAYASQGRPRIALLWDRALAEDPATAYVDRKVVRETQKASENVLAKKSKGPTEEAELKDGSTTGEHLTIVTTGKVAVEENARSDRMDSRTLLIIEKAFTFEMQRAGVSFVDRTLIVRAMAASRQVTSTDPRRIETEALMHYADWLLEIVTVKDAAAPVGYAFDVRVKNLKDGTLIASSYTMAIPLQAPPEPARYVPGADGYELHKPAKANITLPEIGIALARDVMAALEPRLQ